MFISCPNKSFISQYCNYNEFNKKIFKSIAHLIFIKLTGRILLFLFYYHISCYVQTQNVLAHCSFCKLHDKATNTFPLSQLKRICVSSSVRVCVLGRNDVSRCIHPFIFNLKNALDSRESYSAHIHLDF